MDVEVWPSGTRFAAGESLLLVLQGTDVLRYPEHLTYARHTDTVNVGRHTVHTGGEHASHLLVPVLPTGGTDRSRSNVAVGACRCAHCGPVIAVIRLTGRSP